MTDPSDLPDLGDVVERLDHVAFGVADVARGAEFVHLMGGRFFDGADSPVADFRWAQFAMPGGGKIELIAPLSPGSFVATFLDRRGEGIHHITLKVHDLDEAVARAESAGQRVVGHARLHQNWAEAFLHPSTALGAVVQLAEWDDSVPGGSSDWGALLRGEVVEGT